ncbi:hypothetical protein B0J14DRAFT_644938 [Halenospora varia]|nr:hypothetical protein B0J14DRAFT_644938 [Halenospora varia]
MSQPPPPPNNTSSQSSSTSGGVGNASSSSGGHIVALARHLASLEATANASGSSSSSSVRLHATPVGGVSNAGSSSFVSGASRTVGGPSTANANIASFSGSTQASSQRLVPSSTSANASSSAIPYQAPSQRFVPPSSSANARSASFASRYSYLLNGTGSANTTAALASFPSAASRLVAIAPSLNTLSSAYNSGLSSVPVPASTPSSAPSGARFPEMTLEELSQNVTIIVGSGVTAKTFLLPECIVVRHSPVMKTALKDAWQQGEKKEIVLKEEEPENFATFLAWVYTGDIDSSATVPKATAEDTEAKLVETQIRFEYLLGCYILGNFLQADSFKNAIIDKVLQDYKTAPGDGGHALFYGYPHIISKLYCNTSPKDPLRKFLVDLYMWECDPETFTEGMATLSNDVHFREFGFELLGAAWIATKESHNLLLHAHGIAWGPNLRPPTGPPGHKGSCRYHVHSDAEEGYKCDQK